MRRKDRALSKETAIQILKDGECGILATCGEAGQPYGVPLSYVYHDGRSQDHHFKWWFENSPKRAAYIAA